MGPYGQKWQGQIVGWSPQQRRPTSLMLSSKLSIHLKPKADLLFKVAKKQTQAFEATHQLLPCWPSTLCAPWPPSCIGSLLLAIHPRPTCSHKESAGCFSYGHHDLHLQVFLNMIYCELEAVPGGRNCLQPCASTNGSCPRSRLLSSTWSLMGP